MKFQSLDGFRGIAAILVVLYHSRFNADPSHVAFVKNSYLFVDFFFILSGFIMTHAYWGRIGETVTFKKFVVLRIGRLYPLHLFMLLLWLPYIAAKTYVYSKGMGATDPLVLNNASSFLASLFLVQSLGFYDLNALFAWNFPSWSISTEFYTYLLFFVAVVIFSRQSVVLKVLFGLCLLGLLFLSSIEFGENLGSFVECVVLFFLGSGLYRVSKLIEWRAPNPYMSSVLEVILLITVVLIVSNADSSIVSLTVVSFSFTLLILLFSIQNVGVISKILEGVVFQKLGKWSYSIYMVHALILAVAFNVFDVLLGFSSVKVGNQEVLVFAEANIVNIMLLLAVVFFSALTYRYVEIPWRDRFRKMAKRM